MGERVRLATAMAALLLAAACGSGGQETAPPPDRTVPVDSTSRDKLSSADAPPRPAAART